MELMTFNKPHVTSDNLKPLVDEAYDALAMTIAQGVRLVSLFSGGKDSIVATHIAQHIPAFYGVGHVKTLTGVASLQHSDMVKTYAKERGWNYIEKSPATTLPMLVAKEGNFGPGAHSEAYKMLKERPIRQITITAKRGASSIVYATGIRRAESTRRANAPEMEQKTKTELWTSPLINWTDSDVFQYMQETGLTVTNKDHSVDCWCGAFATPDEREITRIEQPKQFIFIQGLEHIAESARAMQLCEVEAGLKTEKEVIPESFCRWGHGLSGTKATHNNAGLSICNDCHGRLASDGSGSAGVDPDRAMYLATLKAS